ncbi:MAG: hypothetical protein PHR06_04195 [Candidatus Cloacimonetes bacterium]|nr:hypothetical protein [Candidatus Cloacimonadota bacterium]
MHEIRVSIGTIEKQREMTYCLLPRIILRHNRSKTTGIYTHKHQKQSRELRTL